MRKILTALLLFLSPLSFAQENVSLADVPLKTLDNQTVTLSQYQGKPLYIKIDRKSTRLNSSHTDSSRMPSSA